MNVGAGKSPLTAVFQATLKVKHIRGHRHRAQRRSKPILHDYWMSSQHQVVLEHSEEGSL
jgi:hypothetical protein